MEVLVLKPFELGSRRFEPGYELDISNPDYIGLDGDALIANGTLKALKKASTKRQAVSGKVEKAKSEESKGEE